MERSRRAAEWNRRPEGYYGFSLCAVTSLSHLCRDVIRVQRQPGAVQWHVHVAVNATAAVVIVALPSLDSLEAVLACRQLADMDSGRKQRA